MHPHFFREAIMEAWDFTEGLMKGTNLCVLIKWYVRRKEALCFTYGTSDATRFVTWMTNCVKFDVLPARFVFPAWYVQRDKLCWNVLSDLWLLHQHHYNFFSLTPPSLPSSFLSICWELRAVKGSPFKVWGMSEYSHTCFTHRVLCF